MGKSKFPVENSKTRRRAAKKIVGETTKSVKKAAKPSADGADYEEPTSEKVADGEEPTSEKVADDEDLKKRFITELSAEELASIQKQLFIASKGEHDAKESNKTAINDQVVANMLRAAYNAAWQSLQRKHGLPEALDIDWKTGAIYRKKKVT